MKPSEIYVGLKVVATQSKSATVYTVHQIIDKFTVLLTYERHNTVWSGGIADVCMLSLPTIEQLAND